MSGAVMAAAAQKAAAQPGYAFTFRLGASGQVVKGTSSASGSGHFQARRLVGTIMTRVTVPSGLGTEASLLGSLKTKVILPGDGHIYVAVPGGLARLLGGKHWLAADERTLISAAGSSAAQFAQVTPSRAFGMLARASSGKAQNLGTATIEGRRTTHYREAINSSSRAHVTVDMWIAGDGLPYQLATGFSASGASGRLTLDITSFAAQPTPTAPPASQTGSLSKVIKEASSSLG